MKNTLLILSLTLLVFACKKENADYRDKVVGTYSGRANYYDSWLDTFYHKQATIHINLDPSNASKIAFTGDVLDKYIILLNQDYTIEAGAFRNDSLIFIMTDHHQYTFGYYYLKKQ